MNQLINAVESHKMPDEFLYSLTTLTLRSTTTSTKTSDKPLRTMKAMERPTKSLLESFLLNDSKKTPTAAPIAAKVQKVHCPTCGRLAERYHFIEEGNLSSLSRRIVRTQCSHCDYLMITCADTGRVIEAYAPSFSPAAFASAVSAMG